MSMCNIASAACTHTRPFFSISPFLLSFPFAVCAHLNDNNILYWLDGESLLGAVRDDGVMWHEYDNDISYIINPADPTLQTWWRHGCSMTLGSRFGRNATTGYPSTKHTNLLRWTVVPATGSSGAPARCGFWASFADGEAYSKLKAAEEKASKAFVDNRDILSAKSFQWNRSTHRRERRRGEGDMKKALEQDQTMLRDSL